ncbi:hypothetical protein T265_07215 [Opisthorchis viverrini]|uniref:Uncharacterized protein n=1 Tax=Opisthorchis viverrini TaxID=6198 RepID=A0A074ZHV0_OPIVI|nr:hypothetical protein T265_07215 [Opisthorchis viverrini]KER25342.1 hypothetical protein T265_07215 [Opisthorchis viverrini]
MYLKGPCPESFWRRVTSSIITAQVDAAVSEGASAQVIGWVFIRDNKVASRQKSGPTGARFPAPSLLLIE